MTIEAASYNAAITGVGLRRPTGIDEVATTLEGLHERLMTGPQFQEAPDAKLPKKATDRHGQSRRALVFPANYERLDGDEAVALALQMSSTLTEKNWRRMSAWTRLTVAVVFDALNNAEIPITANADQEYLTTFIPSIMPGAENLRDAILFSGQIDGHEIVGVVPNRKMQQLQLARMVAEGTPSGLTNTIAKLRGGGWKNGRYSNGVCHRHRQHRHCSKSSSPQ